MRQKIREADPWCLFCNKSHPAPRDSWQWQALKCLRPWCEWEKEILAGLRDSSEEPMPTPTAHREPRSLEEIRKDQERDTAALAELRAKVEAIAAASAPPEPLRKLLEEFFGEVEEFAGRVRPQAPTWVRSQLRVILTKYRAEIALAAPPVSAWTAEPPKMGGFWWWRYSKEDKPLPRLVVDRGKLDGCFVHQVCGWVLVQLIGGEWQGPIEPK